MKRLLTLAAMFLCCMATAFAQFSGSGSGTENDPYLILNPIQLNQIRNFPGGAYFKLLADIDLTEFIEDEYPNVGWLPINIYGCNLDGNGKTISGLWINRDNTDEVGLFSNFRSGNIKNLFFKNVDIKGKDKVGAIAGEVFATTISNCHVEGTINGQKSVGSFVGCISSQSYSESSFENLTGIVNIRATGSYVGGILGGERDGTASFDNCKIIDSSISGFDYVGGLSGRSWTIKNSSFKGTVDGHSYVGGLTGYGTCNISNSYAYGDIQASGDNIGGIAGYCYGYQHSQNWKTDILYLNNCQFYGNLYGENNIGGIAGYYNCGDNYVKTGIRSCLVNATLNGDDCIGGICGTISKRAQWGYMYLENNVSASTKITVRGEKLSLKTDNRTTPLVGRIFSYNELNSQNLIIRDNKSYNRAIILSQGIAIDVDDNEKNGTGVSATTLKLKATFVAMDWDFNDTWEIQETECYPYFKTQTAPPVITSKVVSGATTISGKCVDGGTITLEIDGMKLQMVSSNHEFSFTVSPLQAGHEVRISAKAEGKEQSYFTTEIVAYLGKGTEADPYQVYTAADLTGVYRKGYFKMMNDIDLTDYINQFSPTEGWESIGREGSETIHFDGNGHKITGLWCNSTRDNTGLFSCFANGTIKNLTVETAKNKQVKGGANTGIIIGKMINGTIENCRVSGKVADGTPVGGLVGLFDGGKISLSQANITINTAGEKSYIGGLVGEITGGEIDQCVTQGEIMAIGKESYVGGLVGMNSATVTNCYSNADITSSYCAAGLIAYNYGLVEKSYAVGNLTSKNYAAGVVGYNDGTNAKVRCCVAMNKKMDLTYESQSGQGGGYGQRIIGGIKNGAPTPELNNYALKTMKVSVNNVAQKVYDDVMNGIGKVGADLMSESTYQELGWDFSNVWSITEGKEYPSLKYNPSAVLHAEADPVTITAKSYSRVYGDANPTFEYVSAGATLVGIPEISCEATVTSPVGIYPIIIKKGSVTNENDTYVNGTLTITKASLAVKAGAYSKKQGEENPEFTLAYEGWKNNETEAVLTKKPTATTTATKNSEPGEYDVIVSGGEAKNYELSYTNGKLIVTQADAVVIIAKSYTRVYGDANPTFEYTSEGATLVGAPEITCEATATSPVGTYPIVISKGKVTNYNDTYINGTLTITKAPLKVTVENVAREQYLDNPDFVITYTGWKLNDDENVLTKKPTATTTATKESPVGEYEIVVSGGEAKNYELNYENGILTVTESTGIATISVTRPVNVYNVQGRMVRSKATTLDGLPKGVYIVNGRKVVVRQREDGHLKVDSIR